MAAGRASAGMTRRAAAASAGRSPAPFIGADASSSTIERGRAPSPRVDRRKKGRLGVALEVSARLTALTRADPASPRYRCGWQIEELNDQVTRFAADYGVGRRDVARAVEVLGRRGRARSWSELLMVRRCGDPGPPRGCSARQALSELRIGQLATGNALRLDRCRHWPSARGHYRGTQRGHQARPDERRPQVCQVAPQPPLFVLCALACGRVTF